MRKPTVSDAPFAIKQIVKLSAAFGRLKVPQFLDGMKTQYLTGPGAFKCRASFLCLRTDFGEVRAGLPEKAAGLLIGHFLCRALCGNTILYSIRDLHELLYFLDMLYLIVYCTMLRPVSCPSFDGSRPYDAARSNLQSRAAML